MTGGTLLLATVALQPEGATLSSKTSHSSNYIIINLKRPPIHTLTQSYPLALDTMAGSGMGRNEWGNVTAGYCSPTARR